MMAHEAVIGLEVHAQLSTRTKIFCACAVDPRAEPNTLVCPVCLGHPGALPVLNRRAVEFAVRAALALGATVHPQSAFARKLYFYPDLPKGYQITQFDRPMATGGRVEFQAAQGPRTARVRRIHLEEDAGKAIHDGPGGRTRLDFNRAGVPLIEIVTEPDIRSPAEAAACLRTLRRTLAYLGVCGGDMEEGALRCDANVSVRPAGSDGLGAKTEIKNLNSFKFVERALAREIGRQVSLREGGGAVRSETLLYDAKRDLTRPMRTKEEEHDYRYFPEPDLQALRIDEGWTREIAETLPELPGQRLARFVSQYSLPARQAEALTAEHEVADYFEDCVRLHDDPATVANWVMNDLMREVRRDRTPIAKCPVTPNNLVSLIKVVARGKVSLTMAREILRAMYASGSDAPAILKERGLAQVSASGDLEATADAVIAAHPAEAGRCRAGERRIIDYFMGEIMKATGGRANPAVAREIVVRKLRA